MKIYVPSLVQFYLSILQDIFVSSEFKELQKQLERDRPITITHAGVLMERESVEIIAEVQTRESFQRDPFGKLKNYCRKAGYRLIDLFKDLDKDGSMNISLDELVYGLKVTITNTQL